MCVCVCVCVCMCVHGCMYTHTHTHIHTHTHTHIHTHTHTHTHTHMHKHSFPPTMLVVSNSILGLQQISTVWRLAKFALCCSFQLILLFFLSDQVILCYLYIICLWTSWQLVFVFLEWFLIHFFNVIFVHMTQRICLLILSASLLVIHHTHEITQGTLFIMC